MFINNQTISKRFLTLSNVTGNVSTEIFLMQYTIIRFKLTKILQVTWFLTTLVFLSICKGSLRRFCLLWLCWPRHVPSYYHRQSDNITKTHDASLDVFVKLQTTRRRRCKTNAFIQDLNRYFLNSIKQFTLW